MRTIANTAALLVALALPAAARAQAVPEPAGVVALETAAAPTIDSTRHVGPPTTTAGRIATRSIIGALVALPAVYVGGVAGVLLIPHSRTGEEAGLGEAVVGAAAGVATAFVLAAAVPEYGSTCSRPRRTAAAMLGLAPGLLLASASRGQGPVAHVLAGASLPLTLVGPAAGATLCRARHAAR